MTTMTDLQTNITPTWCPGCGDYGIWNAFRNASVKAGWDDTNSAIVAGIGCHGHIFNFVKMSAFEGLHGRAIPVASGIKFANHKLNVMVFTGDGDGMGEGGNHFIHGARRNQDLAIFIHDNAVYGLTTGQTSPVSPHDYKSKSSPLGNPDEPIHPLLLALASGATFVARGYAGDVVGLSELMIQAVNHRGFAVVDILQPCVTFNHVYTHQFYQQNMYKLPNDWDKTNKITAMEKALEWGEKKIPIGIFYQVESPTQEDYYPWLGDEPLAKRNVEKRDIGKLMEEMV